jgi:signal peptidase I
MAFFCLSDNAPWMIGGNVSINNLLRENRGFLLFLGLMFVFRSAVADWNHVPSESMLPTIKVGDRLGVNKLAYDLRVPFTHVSLYRFGNPERGDIVIFDSEATGNRMVKRVVGLPGDRIAMDNDRLVVNGEPVMYEALGQSQYREQLGATSHTVSLINGLNHLSNFEPVDVPEGHYLVLGDNRDNSADSRVIGFIPRDEIVGRTRHVVMSFNYDNYYLPRSDRFLHTL